MHTTKVLACVHNISTCLCMKEAKDLPVNVGREIIDCVSIDKGSDLLVYTTGEFHCSTWEEL